MQVPNNKVYFSEVLEETNALILSATQVIGTESRYVACYSAPHFFFFTGAGLSDHGRSNGAAMVIAVLVTGVFLLIGSLFERNAVNNRLAEWVGPEGHYAKLNANAVYLPANSSTYLKTVADKTNIILNARKEEAKINLVLCLGIIAASGAIIAGILATSALSVAIGSVVLVGIAAYKIKRWIYNPTYDSATLEAAKVALATFRQFNLPQATTKLADIRPNQVQHNQQNDDPLQGLNLGIYPNLGNQQN